LASDSACERKENLTALGLDFVGAITPGVTGLGAASRVAKGADKIPWSSKPVRDAAKALEQGATEVSIGSRSQAEELFFGRYQGQGYRNTTGMSPTEAKDFFGGKIGTYHWDEGAKNFPHGADHLQIHTFEGDVLRIYFQ